MRTDRVAWVYFFWGSRHAKKLIDIKYSLRGLGSLQFCLEHSFGILAPRISPSGPFPQGKGSQMHSRISSSKTYNDTYTHTVSNNRVKEPTNQTNQKVKAMPMGPLQMWSHGTTNTLLDGKQSSGTLKKKEYLPFGQGNLFVFLSPLRRLPYMQQGVFFVQCDRNLHP